MYRSFYIVSHSRACIQVGPSPPCGGDTVTPQGLAVGKAAIFVLPNAASGKSRQAPDQIKGQAAGSTERVGRYCKQEWGE